MKNICKNMSIVLLIFLIIIKRSVVIKAIVTALNIWATNLFPSLFPFLIISDLLISSNLINIIANLLGPFFTWGFKVSKYAAYVFVMSLISGCPGNAKYLKDLLQNKLISKAEASKILAMTLLYNPILILTITSYLKPSDSYLIIGINILINLAIGLINRHVKCDYQNTKRLIPQNFNLIKSISKTMDTLFLILGTLALFIALSALIPYTHPLITGIFEITSGIKAINLIPNYDFQLIFTGILLSFGGLSIQTQIKSILSTEDLEYSLFYQSRIIHLILFILFLQIRIHFFN